MKIPLTKDVAQTKASHADRGSAVKVHECTQENPRTAADLWHFRPQSDLTRTVGDTGWGQTEADPRDSAERGGGALRAASKTKKYLPSCRTAARPLPALLSGDRWARGLGSRALHWLPVLPKSRTTEAAVLTLTSLILTATNTHGAFWLRPASLSTTTSTSLRYSTHPRRKPI